MFPKSVILPDKRKKNKPGIKLFHIFMLHMNHNMSEDAILSTEIYQLTSLFMVLKKKGYHDQTFC